jgi:hypothetical protein
MKVSEFLDLWWDAIDAHIDHFQDKWKELGSDELDDLLNKQLQELLGKLPYDAALRARYSENSSFTVDQKIIDTLKALCGPDGFTILKILEAKRARRQQAHGNPLDQSHV